MLPTGFRYGQPLSLHKLLIITIIIIISTGIFSQIRTVQSTSFQPHATILIDGNSTFTFQNGVVSGSGASRDPYIIEGWSVLGLTIQHTTAAFVVRNVEVLRDGLKLDHSDNGRIEHLARGSLWINSCVKLTISNNLLGDVHVVDSLDPHVSDNVLLLNNTLSGTVQIFTGVVQDPGIRTGLVTLTGNTVQGDVLVYVDRAIIKRNIVAGRILVEGVQDKVLENTAARLDLVGGNVTLVGNMVAHAIIFDMSLLHGFNTVSNNLIDGKPLYYYTHCADLELANLTIGQLVLADCSNAKIVNVRFGGEGSILAWVRDVVLINVQVKGNGGNPGLQLIGCPNARIESSTFETQTVNLSSSANVSITGNVFTGGSLDIQNSDHLQASNNHFRASGNIFLDSGMRVYNSTSPVLSGNRFERSSGLQIDEVTLGLIMDNWISYSPLAGLSVGSVNGLNITGNSFVGNGIGLAFRPYGRQLSVYHVNVYHNNFVSNRDQANMFSIISGVLFDNGYPSGGNYWSDYAVVDKCSGPLQNLCPSPDGIGDTPYANITIGYYKSLSGLVDHYPLMKPHGNFPPELIPQKNQPQSSTSGKTSQGFSLFSPLLQNFYLIFGSGVAILIICSRILLRRKLRR